ncbi:hypothetical protein [Actinoplanes sp. RD1]|uniref:hypothetical protein n=1 Tax=Actinoplanes sp. RD1 TaxID=3064538 RepID=UPI0027422782|nr:hypothetical protein [Actinoplanes sp. RD1]
MPSGVFLSLDADAAVPARVRAAPRINGLVRVWFDRGALGAASITGVQARNAATLDRWTDVLEAGEGSTVSRAQIDERGKAHGMYVDAPGRRDLLDPADDRILPIDNDHRVVDARRATGVRVIPEIHIVDRIAGLIRPHIVPGDDPFPGQLRFHGAIAYLGLPAEVVSRRHAGVGAVPESPAGMAAADGYADLLSHLGSLPVGSRTTVETVPLDGMRTDRFLVINDPDGLSVLQDAGGTIGAARMPRAFSALRYATSPRAGFDRAVAWAGDRTRPVRSTVEIARGNGVIVRTRPGHPTAAGHTLPAVEVVADPAATRRGEPASDRSTMLRTVRDVLIRLAGAHPGTSLTELLDGLPMAVTEAGRRLEVADGSGGGNAYALIEAEVAFSSLPAVLGGLRDQVTSTTEASGQRPDRRSVLEDGLRFGRSMGTMYAAAANTAGTEAKGTVEGYLSLVYTHAAAAWLTAIAALRHDLPAEQSAPAEYLIAVSAPAFGDYLEAMPERPLAFLRNNHDLITRRLQLAFVADNPALQGLLADHGLLGEDPATGDVTVGLTGLPLPGKPAIGHYVSNALLKPGELRRRGIPLIGRDYLDRTGAAGVATGARGLRALLRLRAYLPPASSDVHRAANDLLDTMRGYYTALDQPSDVAAARREPLLAPLWRLGHSDQVMSRVLADGRGKPFATVYPLDPRHERELIRQAAGLRDFQVYTRLGEKGRRKGRPVVRAVPWAGRRVYFVLGLTDSSGNHLVRIDGRGAVRLDGAGIAADLHRQGADDGGIPEGTEDLVVVSDRAARFDPDTESSFAAALADKLHDLAGLDLRVIGSSGTVSTAPGVRATGETVARLTLGGKFAFVTPRADSDRLRHSTRLRFADAAPQERVFPTTSALAGLVEDLGLASGPHLFLLSTAATGGFADTAVPPLPGTLVEQLVVRLGQQYPESRVQLIGPDPHGDFRGQHPAAFVLADALQAEGYARLRPQDRDRLLTELGSAGATLIGATRDIASAPTGSGLRTLWLGGAVEPDGPVGPGPAQSQRLDLPVDWAGHRDVVASAVRDLPGSADALRSALGKWRDSVAGYRARLQPPQSQLDRHPGLVDDVREWRRHLAGEFEYRLDEEIVALERHRGRMSARWPAFREHIDYYLTQLSRLSPVEVFGLLRRAVDNDAAFGAAVVPERVKSVELFPPGKDVESPDTVGTPVRPNPVLTSLADLTAEHFTDRPGATWQFIVTPGNALPRFGTETVSKVFTDAQATWLSDFRLGAARRAIVAELRGEARPAELYQARDAAPEDQVPLTSQQINDLAATLSFDELVDDLRTSRPDPDETRRILELPEVRRVLRTRAETRREYDGLGHPTIGGAFIGAGEYVSQRLQVGGEVRYDAEYGVLVFNDMSGRSMSPKVRPTEAEKFKVWVSNVARMVEAQTGLPWEIGLSKQAAKAAIKRNPRDVEALAQVSIVKSALPDRGAVARLRAESDRLHDRVAAALARLPGSPATAEAARAWQESLNELARTDGSTVGAAERAVAAYATAVRKLADATGPGAARVLPDPAFFFPQPRFDVASGWWIGTKPPPDRVRSAPARAGDRPVVEVRFRDKPDPEDFALIRMTLLNQPIDALLAAVYRPSEADLAGLDPKAVADELGLPLDIAEAQLPDRLRTRLPAAARVARRTRTTGRLPEPPALPAGGAGRPPRHAAPRLRAGQCAVTPCRR